MSIGPLFMQPLSHLESGTSSRCRGVLSWPDYLHDSDVAFRHGWGCPPDQAEAVKYLSAAASNAASVEDLALQAGMKKGGAAKGELVLAIFELANCFRHGWGVQVDKFAAKQVSPPQALDRGETRSISTDMLGAVLRNGSKFG